MSKLKKPAPSAHDFTTVQQVKLWIVQHVEPHDTESGFRTKTWTSKRLNATVLWWYALAEAESWGNLSRKDVARALIAGVPALTLAELQRWLNDGYESEDESEPVAQRIENSLREHFKTDLR